MTGARILIVEDNAPNRELMSYLLTAFGHRIFAVETAHDGVHLGGRLAPDLIVCDVHVADLDGFELARRFRAEPLTATVPLIAVTALAMFGDRERILAAGFDGYLTKPIDPETFVRQIEDFLPPQLHTSCCHAQEREQTHGDHSDCR